MRCLVPAFILRKARNNEYRGSFDAYVLNVDLKGFTNLSHNLLKQSDAGAEELTDVINSIFTPAVESIKKHGGFIAGFAGDAFTAVFPAKEVNGAINSAISIRDYFLDSGVQKTEFGEFEVTANLGLAKGDVEWHILPAKEQYIFWFCGSGINKAIRTQEKSSTNQVLIEQSILPVIDNSRIKATKLNDQYRVLEKSDLEEMPFEASYMRLSQKKFVPQHILKLKIEGELREVLSCFINLAIPNEEQIRAIITLSDRYGGYFNKIDCTDKGWLAVVLFGAPIAYEKSAARAIKFSSRLQNLCSKNIKIGLTYGKTFAGFIGSKRRGEYTALGMPVNLASRYMYRAGWGEIWFDKFIRNELGNTIAFENLGKLEFRGYPKPIETFRMLAKQELKEVPFYESEFIGRISELKRLADSCKDIWNGKFSGVTYIYGEAGQGKSRLVYEMQHKFGDRMQYFNLQTDSIHQNSLNPFAYWLRQKFTRKMTGSIVERRKDFRANWAAFRDEMKKLPDSIGIIQEMDRIESVLAGLIGLEWKDSTYSKLEPKYRPSVKSFALKSLLEMFCLLKPVVLVIEDLHWLDKESEETLQIMTRRADDIPCKIIFTSRVNDDGSYPLLKIDPDVAIETIHLVGLNQSQIADLMSSILKRDLSPDIAEHVNSISHGNPLIVEQLTHYLVETGKIEIRNDQYHLKEQTFQIPEGVQNVIMARLDRLEDDLKQTAQTASVLGLEFPVVVLCKMLSKLEMRPDHINELIIKSQLHFGEQEHIWHAVDRTKYIFSHSLLHDIVYNMQLKKQLKKLHLLAAQVMESLYAEDNSKLEEIAEHYHKAGRLIKAMDYYKKSGDYEMERYLFTPCLENYNKALKLSRKQRGERHQDTADILKKIGEVHKDKGDYEQALQYYEQALSIREEVMGDRHPDTAQCLYKIGRVYIFKGEYNKALNFFDQALSINKEVLGERHPSTADNLMGVGSVYVETGEYDKALDFYEQSLSIKKETLGERHSETAISLYNIGIVNYYQSDYSQALSYFEKALSIWKEVLGERHPDTADSLHTIGVVYASTSDFETAISYHEHALAIRKEILGERHPDTANSLTSIGSVFIRTGDYDKAIFYNEQALSIDKEVLGERHPKTAIDMTNIGVAYANKSDCNQALIYFDQALSINKETMGEQHPITATSLSNIGELYCDKGDHDKALIYIEKALSVRMKIFGERHPYTAASLQNMGDIFIGKEEYDTALDYLEQALASNRKLLGEKHIKTAFSLSSIGVAHFHKGNCELALKYHEQALSIFKEVVNEKHPDTATCLFNIGDVYERKKDLQQALNFHEKALAIRREILTEQHPRTLESLERVAGIYKKTNKHEQREKFRKKTESGKLPG